MKEIFALSVALLAGGCAMGEGARWVGSDNEIVQVDGIPYQVQYVRDATGFDTRVIRVAPLVILPDAMIERRRGASAALMVVQRMCAGAVADAPPSSSGTLTMVRFRCS